MDEKEKINIIKQIQDSNIQLCISFSGVGFQFLNDILKLEGASKCLLNAEIPYSKEALNENFQIKEPFVTKNNSEKLSRISLDRFSNKLKNNVLISIGCIGSIKTYYKKQGDEKAWVYFLTSNQQEHNLFIKFHKDLMNPISREAQDEIINISILLTIRDFINNNYNFPLNDLDENQTLKLESQDVATICAKPKDL